MKFKITALNKNGLSYYVLASLDNIILGKFSSRDECKLYAELLKKRLTSNDAEVFDV
ncbi:MAG: hypothetical protein V4538_17735 [Bacteroidota bacterium]